MGIKSVFLAVVAAASAAPEADPQVLAALPYAAAPVVAAPAAYSFAPVGAVASHSVVKSVEVTPAEVSHEVTAHAVPVAVGYHGYGFGHYYGKGEADPAVIAGRTTVLSAPTPLIHNPPVLPVVHHAAPVVAAPAVAAVGYAGLGYHGYGLPLAHAVVKRDADADPAVVLGALPYAHAPLVAPATFASVGAVAHAPGVKAVVEAPAEVSHEVTAHPVAVGYHGYGLGPYWGQTPVSGLRRSQPD